MTRTKGKFERLEQVFARSLVGVDQEALDDVCAGILDIPDSYRAIFEETLPKFEHLSAESYGELLDELIALRFDFEHIRSHAEDAVAGLEKIILAFQDKE